MTPQMILLIAQALLQYGPGAAKALHDIFSTANPTQAQWDALFAIAKPYSYYVSPTP